MGILGILSHLLLPSAEYNSVGINDHLKKLSYPYLFPDNRPLKFLYHYFDEATACLNGTLDCTEFDKISNLKNDQDRMSYSDYLNAVSNLSLHTSAENCKVEVISTFELRVVAFDHSGNRKNHGGDQIIARIISPINRIIAQCAET